MLKRGNTYRFVTDQLGSVRAVVDVLTGAIVQEIEYDAWGNATLVGGSWDVQPFGFAGGLYDSDTGLVRFGARDYDAEIGRWASKDPITFDGDGPNLYMYAVGQPTNLIDSRGHFIECPPGGCGGFLGGFFGGVTTADPVGGAAALTGALAAFLICELIDIGPIDPPFDDGVDGDDDDDDDDDDDKGCFERGAECGVCCETIYIGVPILKTQCADGCGLAVDACLRGEAAPQDASPWAQVCWK